MHYCLENDSSVIEAMESAQMDFSFPTIKKEDLAGLMQPLLAGRKWWKSRIVDAGLMKYRVVRAFVFIGLHAVLALAVAFLVQWRSNPFESPRSRFEYFKIGYFTFLYGSFLFWTLVVYAIGPGSVRKYRRQVEPLTNAVHHGQRMVCESCTVDKPWNVSHCSICDRCVPGWDHHCVWIGTCIGHENLRSFVVWCLVATVGVVHVTKFAVFKLIFCREKLFSVWHAGDPAFIFPRTCVVCFFLSAVLGKIWVFQMLKTVLGNQWSGAVTMKGSHRLSKVKSEITAYTELDVTYKMPNVLLRQDDTPLPFGTNRLYAWIDQYIFRLGNPRRGHFARPYRSLYGHAYAGSVVRTMELFVFGEKFGFSWFLPKRGGWLLPLSETCRQHVPRFCIQAAVAYVEQVF